jgi:anti-sigma regulatory factor (Ser/Thr protein kinase)
MARPPDSTLMRRPDDGRPPRGVLGSGTFFATPDNVAASRRVTRKTLNRYPTFDGDLVELLVSELATNSVLHSGSDKFSVVIAGTQRGYLRVAVTDKGRTASVPHLRTPELGDEGGRGLWLVSRCAPRWGIRDDGHGCVSVWFEIAEGVPAAGWAHALAALMPEQAGADSAERETGQASDRVNHSGVSVSVGGAGDGG